jgi:hypothetical protein
MARLSIFAAAMTLALTASVASAATLPLVVGTYVCDEFACHDAPFAAIKDFDGRSFSGAHSSGCDTVVLGRQGSRYATRTTCMAQGDGTPMQPFTQLQTVSVLSSKRFVVTPTKAASAARAAYRLCGSLNRVPH